MIEDSDRNCAHCGKRMMVDIGQRDMVGDSTVGEVELVHECWSCGYVERDRAWKRPRIRVVATGPTLAERLHKQRTEGWDVPMQIDTSPFPKGEFDDVDKTA